MKNKALIYTTWPTVCGHLLVEQLIPKSWALIWSWSPFAAITSSTLLEGFPLDVGPLLQGLASIQPQSLVRSGTDVGRLGLARSWRSNSSLRCSMGLRSGLCASQSSSSTPISPNYFCMDFALCMGALSCWNRKGPSPKLEAQNCLECHFML